jgi:hypothetical protein
MRRRNRAVTDVVRQISLVSLIFLIAPQTAPLRFLLLLLSALPYVQLDPLYSLLAQ